MGRNVVASLCNMSKVVPLEILYTCFDVRRAGIHPHVENLGKRGPPVNIIKNVLVAKLARFRRQRVSTV